ncbi:RNA polymerase sigma factor [Patescibacteria group bacterium]
MSKNQKQTDEELAQKSLTDKETFAHLVEKYEAKLLRYIQRLTALPQNHAEDILQEIFIKIYRNLNNFDPKLKFSSWAYRIAHNETINQIKKIKRSNALPLETDDEDEQNLIEILESETDIKQEAIQKETAAQVRMTLNRLPQKYRDVLVLYYLEQKDYNEISDILRKPAGTIATLLHRAKSKFKSLYHE